MTERQQQYMVPLFIAVEKKKNPSQILWDVVFSSNVGAAFITVYYAPSVAVTIETRMRHTAGLSISYVHDVKVTRVYLPREICTFIQIC